MFGAMIHCVFSREGPDVDANAWSEDRDDVPHTGSYVTHEFRRYRITAPPIQTGWENGPISIAHVKVALIPEVSERPEPCTNCGASVTEIETHEYVPGGDALSVEARHTDDGSVGIDDECRR